MYSSEKFHRLPDHVYVTTFFRRIRSGLEGYVRGPVFSPHVLKNCFWFTRYASGVERRVLH